MTAAVPDPRECQTCGYDEANHKREAHPYRPAAVPDPRFRDQLAAQMRRHWSTDRMVNRDGALFSVCGCGGEYASTLTEHQADALLLLTEARFQAAEIQQDDELDELMREPNAERAELVRLARKYDLDNHHNAALCPYCSPDVQAAANQRVPYAACGFCDSRRAQHEPGCPAALASPAPAPHAEQGQR